MGVDPPSVRAPRIPRATHSPWWWLRLALAVLPLQLGLWVFAINASRHTAAALLYAFAALSVVQVLLCAVAIVVALRNGLVGAALAGLLSMATSGAAGFFGLVIGAFSHGGAWGRPLRVRGRQLHPELRAGSDWTRGARPDPRGIDDATRRALEALWLHDAQKEHASVPAFARVTWLLAACGAPADLLAWCQRAALEEIEHAELCFALAAGYGGREHTVEPMPELLVGGLDLRGDALVALATESLADGCLLEDFNADIAADCAAACEEPVTRAVLEQIDREERSHAELSWAIVAWALGHAPATVGPALERAAADLPRYRRPTAVSGRLRSLLGAADPDLLRRHGRLPDAHWAAVWDVRLRETTARLHGLLERAAVAQG